MAIYVGGQCHPAVKTLLIPPRISSHPGKVRILPRQLRKPCPVKRPDGYYFSRGVCVEDSERGLSIEQELIIIVR
jgi:hypothetical protein